MRKNFLLSSFVIIFLFIIIFGNIASAQSYYPFDPFAAWGAIWGACCFIYLIAFIFWILIGIYVYKDAEKRGKSGVLWLIVILIFGIIGLIIWWLVRPPEISTPVYQPQPVYRQVENTAPISEKYKPKYCPNCGATLDGTPIFCFNCGFKLR